jgi:hypothetical protein
MPIVVVFAAGIQPQCTTANSTFSSRRVQTALHSDYSSTRGAMRLQHDCNAQQQPCPDSCWKHTNA